MKFTTSIAAVSSIVSLIGAPCSLQAGLVVSIAGPLNGNIALNGEQQDFSADLPEQLQQINLHDE